MTETPSLPDFDEVNKALEDANSPFSAPVVHGLFCGYIAASSNNSHIHWEKKILGNHPKVESKEVLKTLYETTYQQMNEFSFDFTLLLPSDNADINLRTESLGAFCQGFLAGLEEFHVPIKNREPSDTTDSLNDIIEISKVNYGDIAGTEDEETAYFELMEYVRLAVLMIFQDLHQAMSPDSLH